ncbi:MAG: glutaminase A [Clostridiales bacterium]|nr:glutaminase A [Candidatus Cacconaster stercorequi]
MEELLEEILNECQPYTKDGAVATYIPELAKQDPSGLGMYVICSDGSHYGAGDYLKPFTIQSVMKPMLLLLALMDNGIEYICKYVGVEATGKPFDAINVSGTSLLASNLNPMVNAGAILLCQFLKGENYDERFNRLLDLIRMLADNPEIALDEDVYHSEKSTGAKNRALAYLLKSHGMIWDDVEDVLDCYFKACSIRVCSRDLARIGFVLANHGRKPKTDERVFPAKYARFVNACLTTCGMYDGSGDFAIRVGIPAKSGVGGGIMGVVPTKMGIGIYGPALDEKGNSLAGIRALEEFSRRMYLSIF